MCYSGSGKIAIPMPNVSNEKTTIKSIVWDRHHNTKGSLMWDSMFSESHSISNLSFHGAGRVCVDCLGR